MRTRRLLYKSIKKKKMGIQLHHNILFNATTTHYATEHMISIFVQPAIAKLLTGIFLLLDFSHQQPMSLTLRWCSFWLFHFSVGWNFKETFSYFLFYWIYIAKLLNYSIAMSTDNIYTIFMLWQCRSKYIYMFFYLTNLGGKKSFNVYREGKPQFFEP